MRNLNDLRYERGQLITQMREISDRAATEYKIGVRSTDRLSSEEDTKFTELDNRVTELGRQIADGERQIGRESTIAIRPDGGESRGGNGRRNLEDGSLRSAFSKYLLDGPHAL